MVIDYWKVHPLSLDQSVSEAFAKKMLYFKQKSIEQAREKRIKDDHILKDIEVELANLLNKDGRGFDSPETKERLVKIEVDRNKILKDREGTWRLRSRSIWLQ